MLFKQFLFYFQLRVELKNQWLIKMILQILLQIMHQIFQVVVVQILMHLIWITQSNFVKAFLLKYKRITDMELRMCLRLRRLNINLRSPSKKHNFHETCHLMQKTLNQIMQVIHLIGKSDSVNHPVHKHIN